MSCHPADDRDVVLEEAFEDLMWSIDETKIKSWSISDIILLIFLAHSIQSM
jgi:hypothetical protein